MTTKLTIVPYKGRKRAKKAPRSRVKVKSVSKLMKELDAVFSRFIRVSHAKDSICTCYTCGHKAPIAKMQCGHFVSRFYKATRWNENNCRVQCAMCNLWKRGDLITFRENLVQELGLSQVEHLESLRKQSFKLNAETLQHQIDHYNTQLKSILQNNVV